MKKILYIILFSLLLTSCSGGEQYVSIPEIIAEETDDYIPLSDNRTRNSINMGYDTFDGRYLYNFGGLLDTVDNIIKDTCTQPGCTHNTETCERKFYVQRSIKAYNGGLLYTDKNKLYFRKNSEDTLLYENDFYTDFEQENYARKGFFDIALLDDDGIICSGVNFVFKVGYDGQLIYKPVVFSEKEFANDVSLVDSQTVLICTASMNIISLDLSTGEITQVKEHARTPVYIDGKIYYIFIEDENNVYYLSLNRCDINGKNDERLLDDCYIYCVTHDYIFYTKDSEAFSLFRYDLNSKENKVILDLKELTDAYMKESPDADLFGTTVKDPLYFPAADALILPTDEHGTIGYVVMDGKGENPVYVKGETFA